MASTAIQAQGTIVQISTGTGGAKTASAIALGNPTIITSSAHGFSNGDKVTMAAFTGADAASINALSFVVIYKTTNTFAIALDSTALTITVGSGTATPVTYTAIANVKSFQGFDGSVSELDKTNFASSAKEFSPGLADYGTITFEIHPNDADAGQAACLASFSGALTKSWKVILPSGTTPTRSFDGYVKTFPSSASADGLVTGSVAVRITGAVTRS